MWSHADAIELSTVVSEMGEQWSPKIDPARTELIELTSSSPPPASKPVAPPRATMSGTTSGSRMVIVAHEVPVQKLTIAAVTKVMTGTSSGARLPSRIWVRYGAVAS